MGIAIWLSLVQPWQLKSWQFSLWPPSPSPSLAMATELPSIHMEATATTTGVLRVFMVITTLDTMARERLSLSLATPQCLLPSLTMAIIQPPTATASTPTVTMGTMGTMLDIITRERPRLSQAITDMVIMPPATTTGAHRVLMAINTLDTMARERLSQALEAIMEVITVPIMEDIMEV